jgi:hypothetical protein
MTRLVLVVCAIVLVAGCSREERGIPHLTRPSQVTQPPPQPPPAPPPVQPPRSITLGQDVRDTFRGEPLIYELTAPTDGTLVARVNWDVWFNGTLLVLVLEAAQFKPVPPNWAPVVGRLQVTAGQNYRLTILPGGSDWIYDDAFVLTTSIE